MEITHLKQIQNLGITLDYFIHATSSGGTHSDILLGKELYYPELEVLGINVGEPEGVLTKIIQGIIKEFIEE